MSWRKHFSEMSDVEREEYLACAMWCEACGSLTVDGECDCTRMGTGTQRLIPYVSNGHRWIKRYGFVSCRDCGFIRRSDGGNKECRGVVGVGLRKSQQD